jgi:hypothetical protein
MMEPMVVLQSVKGTHLMDHFPLVCQFAQPKSSLTSANTKRQSSGRLLFPVLLVLAATLTLNGSAQAQIMVNDPSQSVLMNNVSRFSPMQEKEMPASEEVQETIKKPSLADNKAKAIAQPLDLPEAMQATMELDDQAAAGKSDAEEGLASSEGTGSSIHAKAVLVDINSETLNYDKDHDVYVATGAVHMVISEQNSELYCDKLTYDRNQELAIAEGRVIIIKNGQRTEGQYAKIDLTRRSALINDALTDISAVRVKAKQSFVNDNEIILENGKMIISGALYQQFAASGGLHNISQGTGKGSQQAKLRRAYSKKVYENRNAMTNQLSYAQQQLYGVGPNGATNAPPQVANFDDSPDKVSRLSLKAKEIEVVRHEDNYDKITLKHPSLYLGRFKLLNMPDTDFSYDSDSRNVQYLGPDIGSYRSYGGAYAGPGWDFHVGPGSLRLSPVASYGSPGFWSSNGKDGKQIKNGLGFGGIAHYRDPKTTIDLAYNSHVGSPIFYGDRTLFGSVHLMASHNDLYTNGLLGQNERPTYIAQLTDYRVLKNFNKFQVTSFESLGVAKDNFYPNFRENYFVSSKGGDPQTLGRAQLQLQLSNTAPLLRFGKYASLGMRAQLLTSAYSSGDFLAMGRIGPTLNMMLLNNHLQTSLGYTVTQSIGKSPFVFDSYYGGAQNVSLNNLFRVNKFLSIGNQGSYSLNRDNARKSLAVGNMMYLLVGPQDLKATIGYDFINSRSYFGLNYFPGNKNSVVQYDKMRIIQPDNYAQPGMMPPNL